MPFWTWRVVFSKALQTELAGRWIAAHIHIRTWTNNRPGKSKCIIFSFFWTTVEQIKQRSLCRAYSGVSYIGETSILCNTWVRGKNHVDYNLLHSDWSQETKGKECCSNVSSRLWGGALRDDTKNGCEGDYLLLGINLAPDFISSLKLECSPLRPVLMILLACDEHLSVVGTS